MFFKNNIISLNGYRENISNDLRNFQSSLCIMICNIYYEFFYFINYKIWILIYK